MIENVISSIKKILPNTVIVLGGPEVSYGYKEHLEKNADFVVVGEGEATIKELIEYFIYSDLKIEGIKGIAYKKNNEIVVNESRNLLDLDSIPFAYKYGFEDLENRIIYYETSRGCPFNCQYCLSSKDEKLRFLSLNRVQEELKIFLDENVKQVKFVDRTFNCNKVHAITIWKFLIENDNGKTNFHFEISADLLTNEMIELLKTARSGLFQFEVGIQSTNTDTLKSIKRKTDLEKLFKRLNSIEKNINKHVDLIVGLPNESYESFKTSFNMVYNLNPNQLQIGFLKLLKGSGLRKDAEKYGIVYKEDAPYEVLYTNDISFEEIQNLKFLEDAVEIFYNSNKFDSTIKFVLEHYETPFDFYKNLAKYWEKNNYHHLSHSKMALYEIMRAFLLDEVPDKINEIDSFLKFDMYLNDNVKNLPSWAKKEQCNKTKEKIKAFYHKEENKNVYFSDLSKYTPQQLSRICHIESFDYNIIKWLDNGGFVEKNTTYVLFKYAIKGESNFSFFQIYSLQGDE